MTRRTVKTASWLDERPRYEALARRLAPHAILTTKSGPLWRWVGLFLCTCSMGRFRVDTFLERYATTLGPLQAYPERWPRLPMHLLAHESRHTWQCDRLGWLVPLLGWCGAPLRVWAGLAPLAVIYLLLPLPTLLCYGRMWLELDAESASWRIGLQEGWLGEGQVREQAELIADKVSGPDYFWSWPRPWTRQRFQTRAETVIAEWKRCELEVDD